MSLLKKALAAGLSPANVISWTCLEAMRVCGLCLGTAALRAKALLLGVELGAHVVAHGPVALMRWPGGVIRIGHHVSIISSWRRATAAVLAFPTRLRVFGKGAVIDIGPYCQLNGASITARSTSVTLGRQVMLGPNCILVDSDFHAIWPPEGRIHNPGLEQDKPIHIGDYAWLGMHTIVLKGARIGAGAVVGAGSVVTGAIPPNCLAAGAPARVIRRLGP